MKVFVVLCALIAVTCGTLAPFKQAAFEEERVPGRYIIKLKEGVSVNDFVVTGEFNRLNARIRHKYTIINGLSVELPSHLVDRLRSLPGIDSVWEGGIMHAQQNYNVPDGAWGIDRSDQRNYPLDDQYIPRSTGYGYGAKIYICDSGIRYTHVDFGNRARFFYDFEPWNGGYDCNGHGTHVAGSAAGRSYGIATDASLYSARVLNCFGSGIWDDFIKAMELIAKESGNRIANASLGGGRYDIVDEAVENAIAEGVVVAVAAGNSYNDACHYTPARSPNAITVGASVYIDSYPPNRDTRSSISNYGPCLDLFAPGQWITSTWYTSDYATASLSGTSMASPHVAGAAALYLVEGVAPAEVPGKMTADATKDKLEDMDQAPGSPNLLLYVD